MSTADELHDRAMCAAFARDGAYDSFPLSENDLIKFYKEQMIRHRNNAIASRKKAEALEIENQRLRNVLKIDPEMFQGMSAEQMVRELLEKAIEERIVAPHRQAWTDPDPQCRSSGELVGTANLLMAYLLAVKAKARHK